MKLPLDGRAPHLGERLLFQSLPRTHNQCPFFSRGLSWMRFRLPAVLLVPFQITGLVSFQPLKEPSLRPIQPGIDFLRRLFFLHVLHNRELPDLFFHAITSSVVMATIIARKRVWSARCIGAKNGIKGNRCIGASGCTMYWHFSVNC
jgi:hypothetical protein